MAGQRKVKEARELYLPKASGMSEPDYAGYLQRASFFNATGRTLEGLYGMMFRKEVQIVVPESLEQYLKQVDSKGQTAQQFIAEVTNDCMVTCFGGVLVDTPNTDNLLSLKQAEENDIAPYLTFYRAEDIINWKTDTFGRKEILTQVVLRETYEVPQNEFVSTFKYRYRVLDLVNIDGRYLYRQRLLNDGGQPMQDEIYPQKNSTYLSYIPFFLLPEKAPSKPLVLDLANVNISMFHKSADLENGAHWTGVPTPYSLGYEPQTKFVNGKEVPAEKPRLGGSEFLMFPAGTTAVGYMEFNGQGLNQLITMMDKDREDMAILGARIISAEKNGVEAAETAKIHRAGENSVLAAFANKMSFVFDQIFREYLEWITGQDYSNEVSIQINTDYDVAGLSGQELTALVSCWQAGGISKRVLFHNMKQGELIPADIDFEDMVSEQEEGQ